MQENNDKNQGKNGLSFESLDILIAKWKDGTFSEIIDDWKWIFSYSVRYKWAIVFYTILGIFSTSMGLVSSVAGKYLIDIITYIVRGSREEVLHRMQALSPLLLEAIPLTLEEIFIYELGGADYAVRDIVL